MKRPARRPFARLSKLRMPPFTVRLRFTLLYGCMFTVAGAVLLGFSYLLFERATAGMRIIPGVALPRRGCPEAASAWCQQAQGAIHAHQSDLHALLAQSGLALAAMAGLAFVLGWLMAGRVLRPVRVITASARRISAASLHARLRVDGPDDEFNELAHTLNDLLARLETSFTAQRNFVASSSHELRTPLTLDRALLQVALRSPKMTVEQWQATGRELLESSLQQERILEALLTLATSEAGLSRREDVDLSQVITAWLRAADAQIIARGLRVRDSLERATLRGDPDLVERLAANLLNNAVQHNIPEGTIEISSATLDGCAVLSVANTGPVVPTADIDRLYQPFQRLAAARTSDGGGNGLGLSIVAAVATAHKATLTTRARPEGGLCIDVSFPAAD